MPYFTLPNCPKVTEVPYTTLLKGPKVTKVPYTTLPKGLKVTKVPYTTLRKCPEGTKVPYFRLPKCPSISLSLSLSLSLSEQSWNRLASCVCSVIDRRWRQNVVRTKKWHKRRGRVCHWWSYHILTSSVICNWTDARQLGIYLFFKIKNFKKF